MNAVQNTAMKNVSFLLCIGIKSTWLNSQMTHTAKQKTAAMWNSGPCRDPISLYATIQNIQEEKDLEKYFLYTRYLCLWMFSHFSMSLTGEFSIKKRERILSGISYYPKNTFSKKAKVQTEVKGRWNKTIRQVKDVFEGWSKITYS